MNSSLEAICVGIGDGASARRRGRTGGPTWRFLQEEERLRLGKSTSGPLRRVEPLPPLAESRCWSSFSNRSTSAASPFLCACFCSSALFLFVGALFLFFGLAVVFLGPPPFLLGETSLFQDNLAAGRDGALSGRCSGGAYRSRRSCAAPVPRWSDCRQEREEGQRKRRLPAESLAGEG